MLKFFGFTSPIDRLVRWLGTGHSRFSDLPCGLRLEHLALWNRPPVSESPLVVWVYAGIASAHFSRLDRDACAHWLGRAEPHARAAGINAELEVGLLRAQLEMALEERAAARARLDALAARLRDGAQTPVDTECFRARLHYQRAMLCTRPAEGEQADIARAREHYEAIPPSAIPFVSFRRSVGLAYCAWKRGDLDEALALAHRAVDDAGDGGLIRMRVAALNMLSRVVSPQDAALVNERARRMAAQLGDEELMQRVVHSAPLELPP